MIVLDAVTMVVMVVMAVVMMLVAAILVVTMLVVVIVVMMIVIVGREEFRLQFENPVKIERAALQHVRQPHLATLGPVQLGVGVDGTDAAFDLGQFVRRYQIGLDRKSVV